MHIQKVLLCFYGENRHNKVKHNFSNIMPSSPERFDIGEVLHSASVGDHKKYQKCSYTILGQIINRLYDITMPSPVIFTLSSWHRAVFNS